MDGMPTNFYGKLMNGLSDKQKKIVLFSSAISIFAGIGVYSYFKIKHKGVKFKIFK
jgi:hypothetical protein